MLKTKRFITGFCIMVWFKFWYYGQLFFLLLPIRFFYKSFFYSKSQLIRGILITNCTNIEALFGYLLVFTLFLMTLRQLFIGVFNWQELFNKLWSQKFIYRQKVFQSCFGKTPSHSLAIRLVAKQESIKRSRVFVLQLCS